MRLKLNKKGRKYSVFLIIISIFVLYVHNSIAQGEFKIPLYWILGSDGLRLDADNSGDIDNIIFERDMWKLVNFTVEYNLRNESAALWNVSGSDHHIYPRHIEANVGINITNPTSTLHIVGTLNISSNASLVMDGNGNISIYLG